MILFIYFLERKKSLILTKAAVVWSKNSNTVKYFKILI